MRYKPVKHPKSWRTKVLKDPVMRAEYEAFSLQLELAMALKKARNRAQLTQENVASKMDTQKSVIARLEAAGGEGRHSPSITTLLKYAKAVGCDLKIRLVPAKNEPIKRKTG